MRKYKIQFHNGYYYVYKKQIFVWKYLTIYGNFEDARAYIIRDTDKTYVTYFDRGGRKVL